MRPESPANSSLTGSPLFHCNCCVRVCRCDSYRVCLATALVYLLISLSLPSNGSTIYSIVNVRFDVFTAVTIQNVVFWDVKPFGSCKNPLFLPQKRRLLQEPHSITFQKATFFFTILSSLANHLVKCIIIFDFQWLQQTNNFELKNKFTSQLSCELCCYCKIWGFHGVTTQKTPFFVVIISYAVQSTATFVIMAYLRRIERRFVTSGRYIILCSFIETVMDVQLLSLDARSDTALKYDTAELYT
jgi:hypothetical protein